MNDRYQKEESISIKRHGWIVAFLLTLSCAPGGQTSGGSEPIEFESGLYTLRGELLFPAREGVHPAVIMVHGGDMTDRTGLETYEPIMHRFLRAGFAVLSWDTPGYGGSSGRMKPESMLRDRSKILTRAVRLLHGHNRIDSTRIGVWGNSRAGYVIPLALKANAGISFMIAVSCPAVNSVDQTAYLLGRQVRCAGFSDERARNAEQDFIGRARARSYGEYLSYAKRLDRLEIAGELGLGGIIPADEYRPIEASNEWFFDPVEILESTTIPSLIIFGELDTQLNIRRSADMYERALKKAGNGQFEIHVIPGVDHHMIPSRTGCLSEIRGRTRRDWKRYDGAYLDLLEEWLRSLPGGTGRDLGED